MTHNKNNSEKTTSCQHKRTEIRTFKTMIPNKIMATKICLDCPTRLRVTEADLIKLKKGNVHA